MTRKKSFDIRHLVRFVTKHRLATALGLYLFAWISGALVLYFIGYSYGGHEIPIDNEMGATEHSWSLLQCFYMAAITLTTVGFEVAVPYAQLSEAGENATLTFLTVYSLTSYFVAVYATSAIVSFFVEGTLQTYFHRRRMSRELRTIKNHYIVCGVGTLGSHLIHELDQLGHDIVVIDQNVETLQSVHEQFDDLLTVQGDALEDETLERARIERAAGLFAVLPEDRDNILLTVSARQANSLLRIVARSDSIDNETKFTRVGANAVISPNYIGGLRMASQMVRPQVMNFLDALSNNEQGKVHFSSVGIPEKSKVIGKPLQALGIYQKVGVAVIGIVAADGSVRYNPGGSTLLDAGDSLIVVADDESRAKLEQLLA